MASHVAAFIGGMKTAGIATTAKHFPGLGRVVGNTDFTAAVTDTVTTVDEPYLQPFQRAIESGVPVVMVSLATYERIDPDHLAVVLAGDHPGPAARTSWGSAGSSPRTAWARPRSRRSRRRRGRSTSSTPAAT